jgi:GGDEF domain-containing protein
MVSIRESVEELDRSHKLRELTLECYISAIQSVAQYAIDLEDKLTGPFRQHVAAVAAEAACGDAAPLKESRSTLRGLLREYRDKASEYINHLREQFANSARALEEIMESMAQADGDSDSRMRAVLGRLREVAAKPECAPAQTAILASAHALESGIDQMRKQHQLTVSQFHSEIRVLHQRIQAMEAAAMVDELSKLLVREEMEERIRGAGQVPYSLLLIRVNGLRSAERQHGAGVAAELTGAFGKRLRAGLPAEASIGRWSEERFIALTNLPKKEAFTCARRLTESLSGSYSCMKDGKSVRSPLQTSIAVVDRDVEEPPARTLTRVNEFFKI